MGLIKTMSQSSAELKDILDRLTALESGETFVTTQMFNSLNQTVTNLSTDVETEIAKIEPNSNWELEFFKTCIRYGVNTQLNADASYVSGSRVRFGDWAVDVRINNSGTDKYLEIYTEIDMGENDEIFLSVFSNSTSQNTEFSPLDNPFKEYSGSPIYLKGNTLNGATALAFVAESPTVGTVLGKIKLPNEVGTTYYTIMFDYIKVTF